MILRRSGGEAQPHLSGAGHSLRLRLAALAGIIVAVVILVTALFAYRLALTTRMNVMDNDLRTKTLGVSLQLRDANPVSYTHLRAHET